MFLLPVAFGYVLLGIFLFPILRKKPEGKAVYWLLFPIHFGLIGWGKANRDQMVVGMGIAFFCLIYISDQNAEQGGIVACVLILAIIFSAGGLKNV